MLKLTTNQILILLNLVTGRVTYLENLESPNEKTLRDLLEVQRSLLIALEPRELDSPKKR